MDQLLVQNHEVERRKKTYSTGDYFEEPLDASREIIDVLQKAYCDLQHILEKVNKSFDLRATGATLKCDGVTVAAKQLIEVCSNIVDQFQPEDFSEGCLQNKRISALMKRDSGISSTRGSVCSSNASNLPDMDSEMPELQSGKINKDILTDNLPVDKSKEPSGVSFYLGDGIKVLQEEMYKLSVASTTDGKVCFAFKPSTARCDRPVFICTNEEQWENFNDLDRTAEECENFNNLDRTAEENTEPSECDNTSRQTSFESVGSACSRCGRRPSIMLANIYATCD